MAVDVRTAILMAENDSERLYEITSTCKTDMKFVLENRSMEINKLSAEDMRYIASKLADDYITQMYWESLTDITTRVLDDKKKEKENAIQS
jgi:hypothetical protein